MVEERHATFDRRGHAHLILLHEQLDEIRLQIRVTHPIERAAGRLGVMAQALRVDVPRRQKRLVGDDLMLQTLREYGEVVEEEIFNIGFARKECSAELPSH